MTWAVTDSLNLVDYILDPLHNQEFSIPSGLDLAALRAGLSADLDFISQAARYAIDHPENAMEPEAYVQKSSEIPLISLHRYHRCRPMSASAQ